MNGEDDGDEGWADPAFFGSDEMEGDAEGAADSMLAEQRIEVKVEARINLEAVNGVNGNGKRSVAAAGAGSDEGAAKLTRSA